MGILTSLVDFTGIVGLSLTSQLLLATFFVLTILAIIYNDRAVGTRRRPDLPKAGGQPLVGNLFSMRKMLPYRLDGLLQRTEDFFKKTGKLVSAGSMLSPVGAIETVFTADVKDIERVFKDPWNYTKGPLLANNLRDLLGHGIFASDGDRWSQQRKTASNIFNLRNFRDFYSPEFNEEVERLCSHLDVCAKEGFVLDLYDIFHRCTFDSFSRIALGKDFGCMTMDKVVICPAPTDVKQDCLALGLKTPLKKYTLKDEDFMVAFDTLNSISILRNLNPLWRISEYFGPTGKKVKECKDIIAQRAGVVIDEKRKQIEQGVGEDRKDLLDFFFEQAKAHGTEMSNQEARDVVMNFLIAGRDTSAQTLSWLFWELSKHPDVEEKLRQEAFDVLGKDGIATYESLKDLKYTNAVLLEGLRLHPNVPMGRKYVVKDDVLPGTNTPVYAGTNVAYSSWVMGRLEPLWGPDAKDFKPERWFDESGNLKRESPFKLLGFNAGPRICLGQNFATQEIMVFVSTLIRRYKFHVVGEDSPRKWTVWNPDPSKRVARYGTNITLTMRGGLDIVVEKISQ